jgi:ATP-dependent helicase IRC3
MIGEKWLSDVLFTTVTSHVDLSKVKANASGDYSLGSLSRACNTREANDITVRTWLAKADGRKSTLVFCVDTAHVADLAATFRKYGLDARFVLGTDRPDARSAKLWDFKEGHFPVMLNCGVFTEGTDIPNIDCIILARPTRSRNLLVQMIGRGMRLHPEKKNCHVLDMVASLNTGIVTTPTLFGLDPDHVLNETTAKELKERSAGHSSDTGAKPGAPISKVTFVQYNSVQDFLNDHAEDRHIRRLSRNAWVTVGQERFILMNRVGEYVTIETDRSVPEKAVFRVRCIEKAPIFSVRNRWRPLKRAEMVATAETFEAAVHAADTYVASKDNFERFMTIVTAPWRKAPCTEEQLAFLNRTVGKTNPLRQNDLTKGQAADMITKVKFGARGRFEKIMASVKRAQNEGKRVEELRKREAVAVGPIR